MTDTEVNSTEDNELYEFPLSPAQAALWFINQFNPGSSAYNIPICVRMVGAVNIDALQQSLDYLVQRHEVFRTFYGNNGSEAVQFVRPEGGCQLSVETIPGGTSDEREQALNNRLSALVASPFDLQTEAVLRANLFTLSDNEFCLLIAMHHIAVDHSAVEHFIRELRSAYSCYLKGEEPDFPEQELQYADYVIWLKENTAAEDIESKLDIWRDRLKNFSGVLNLPLEAPRPPVATMKGAQYLFDLDAGVSGAVKDFSKGQSVSLYLSLLSAFKVLLHRYCSQDDIIVGTPFANRGDQEELESVIGCFINTLPLATDFSTVTGFSSVIDRVKAVMLEVYENQSVPLDAIVEAVNPKRDPSYNPLFQVGFVFQEPPVELDFPGIECTNIPLHSGGAMYDIHIWMWEKGDILSGLVWYNTDVYTEQSMQKLIGNLQTLLSGLVEDPNKNVRQIELLTAAEHQDYLQKNNTAADWPADSAVPALLSATAKQSPESIAVISGQHELTYAELEQRSDQLAYYLVSQGVESGEFVGICMNRSADLLVALLGVLKVGACYVPLDPAYPNDRLQYMIEQSKLALLVTESSLHDSLPDYTCAKVDIDTDWQAIAASQSCTLTDPTPESLMYVIFTSGSTGLPKGVQVPHSTVVNFLTTMAQRPGLSASDKLLAVTTLSFDIAVLELYLPLLVGATLVLASREEAEDGQRLVSLMAEQSVNVMQATPSTWRLLLAAGWHGADDFKVLCGGEAFPRDLAGELLSRKAEVWNMYGPTETTVWSTCYPITEADSPILIGKPIANTQCYVVNDSMQLQPVGVAGELYIGGDGVTAGYLGREDLTTERFVDDIFSPQQNGNKLYRTGDMVRWLADGNLEYLDRIDNQVKVRGFRIELEEIENTLLKLDNILECAVVVKELNAMDKRLVGYIRFDESGVMTSSEVRRYLRGYLPDYMVLQHMVELEEMPLTPNGKINRKALPDPFEDFDHSDEESFIAPDSDAEKSLAAIWSAAIGVEQVSADSYFFEIGGHSLLALEVVYKIEAELGLKLQPQELLMNSLEQIALKLNAEPTADAVADGGGSRERGLLGRFFNKFSGK